VFIELARRLSSDTNGRNASRLFHYSLLYLALLFAAIAADALAVAR
jgi:heme O synthase-like polyprenyltransferase